MAFPTVQSRTTGASTATATSHTVTLPATINAGDLLLVAFTCGGGSGTTLTWDNTTAGTWTTVADATHTTAVRGTLLSKVASGTESGAALSITLSASAQVAWTIWRITGHQGSVEAGSAIGSSVTIAFSALTPSWGADDNLWIAAAHINSSPTVSTYSTNYTNPTRAAGTGTGRMTTESCERLLNASSETPSSWTLSGANTHVQYTIAVRPSGGLTITSVTPSTFDSGITDIVIAGNNFGASQGSSTVDIGGVAQTVTAWSNTSITITSARGSNSMGAGQLKVTVR